MLTPSPTLPRTRGRELLVYFHIKGVGVKFHPTVTRNGVTLFHGIGSSQHPPHLTPTPTTNTAEGGRNRCEGTFSDALLRGRLEALSISYIGAGLIILSGFFMTYSKIEHFFSDRVKCSRWLPVPAES